MRSFFFALRRFFLLACILAACALGIPADARPLFAEQSAAQKHAPAGGQAVKATPEAVAAESQTRVSAANVYAQEAYTEKELLRFMESLPHFLAWARSSKADVRPAVNAAGKPDFVYSPEAAARARELGWEPGRFFCLLGKTAAALYLVEEGVDSPAALPPDMPALTGGEMALARKHLASLLRAGAGENAPASSR